LPSLLSQASGGQKLIFGFSTAMLTPIAIGFVLYFLFNPTRGLLVKKEE